MTKVYYTTKAKEIPPYGANDDEIILQVIDDGESLVMRNYEFEWLAQQLFEKWKLNEAPYIQIVKEWNECLGFQDLAMQASLIGDLPETILAIALIDPLEEEGFDTLEKEDLQQLLQFLERNKDKQIQIRKQ